jgi:hypothetical protein
MANDDVFETAFHLRDTGCHVLAEEITTLWTASRATVTGQATRIMELEAEREELYRALNPPDVAAPSPAVDRAALIALLLDGLNGELSEEGMGDVFWHIEGNYHREGSGPGSRFEDMMLTTVQARWARSHLVEAAVDCLIAAGVVCGRGAS